MTDHFWVLLTRISAQLSEHEVRCLVHMCNIPECQRAAMKDGISLFDILKKRDFINEHKLDSLKNLLRNLSPKRRDLVRLIEKFENGTQDDASSTLTSVVSVTSSITPNVGSSDVNTSPCCTLKCPCMLISCYKCRCKTHWSYVLATAFFVTCFLFIALFWYADVPKVSAAIKSDEHVRKSGPYVLCAIIVLFLASLLSICYIKKRRNRRSKYALSAGNQNGMQEVREESVSKSRDTKRAGKPKARNVGIPNAVFSRNVDHGEDLDSGNLCINTDEDALSRDFN